LFEFYLTNSKIVYMNIVIQTPHAPAPIGPYNQAIQAGNTLYVSGQVALDGAGKMLNESLDTEVHQVMQNLQAILLQAGMSFADVVKCSIFLQDFNDFARVNELYGSYFTANFPARETVQVSRLPKDARLEIACIAVKN
jgi:2-iminobutanoate/2-iminopropanoate deaminase